MPGWAGTPVASDAKGEVRVARMKGRDVLLQVLATEGVVHVFGNPGTTELPFIDALSSAPQFEYVLVLHEGIAIGMADGYAQVTGRPSFVNLHTAPGLGNAMGVLTNVKVTGTPMVVTAGQQHRGHLLAEPFLSGDLVDMARSVTKWAYEVHSLQDLGPALRRAFQEAQHHPSGPVFVSIPMDLLDEEGDVEVPALSRVDRGTIPADLPELARSILSVAPGRFAVVAGDEVAASSGGVPALVGLAEALGCPVFGTPMHSNTVFPTSHPLWGGALPADAAIMREILSGFDSVLLIGRRGFMTFPYRPVSPIPPDLRLIHLSPSPSDLGRTYPTWLGVVGDPAATLSALVGAIGELDPRRAAPEVKATRREPRDSAGTRRTGRDTRGMVPIDAVQALVGALPSDMPVVDEAVINDPLVRSSLQRSEGGRFFYSRGGGLGWGIAAGLGISLARGREPVVCLVGDGAALYGIHALWTAARQGLPVVVAVLNNRHYLILRKFLEEMAGTTAGPNTYVGIEIDDPAIDFVALAHGFGIEGHRVEEVGDIPDAVKSALAAGAPVLLDLQVGAVT
jgi:benzoylformate decarboxylase